MATTWLSLPAQVAIEAHHGWRLQVSEKQQTQCITHWIPLGFCSWIPKRNRTLNTPGYLVDMWKVLIFILVLFDYVFNVRFILGIQEQKPNGIQWVIHWVCCFSLTCSLQPWCASIATCAGSESQVVATVRVAFKHLAKYFKKKMQEKCHSILNICMRIATYLPEALMVMHVFFLCSDAHLNSQVILIIFSRRFSQNWRGLSSRGS